MADYLIKLYVTGMTARARRAIASLRRICQEQLAGRYDLQVVNVLENPQLAEDEKILATPTAVKELPPPVHRVIGDLSNGEQVLLGLDLCREKEPVSAKGRSNGQGDSSAEG